MSGAITCKPSVTPEDAVRLLADAYAVAGRVRALPGERDATFAVESADGRRYVLKIASVDEPAAALSLELSVLDHLDKLGTGLRLPRVVPTVAGGRLGAWAGDGARHDVRLFSWVEGVPWAEIRPHGARLRSSLGAAVGRLSNALGSFDGPLPEREFIWDLTRLERIEPHVTAMMDADRRSLIEAALAPAVALAPRLSELPRGLLYNDANDWNVLVDGDDARDRSVVGFVDFGDMLAGPAVIDLAVAIAYGIMGTADPLTAAAEIVRGYNGVRRLAEAELEVLFPLVKARLAVSLTLSATRASSGNTDPYLGISAAPASELLRRLVAVHDHLAEYTFRAACELEPCTLSPRVRAWVKRNASAVRPVLDALSGAEPVAIVDLSIDTPDYGTLADIDDLDAHSRDVGNRIAREGARAGIGRWNEVRAIYRADAFRAAGNDREEYRTVHIGLDVFAPAGTPVYAPLEGTVHSLQDNAGRYDYGPTVILEHQVRDEAGEFAFHSLYGHLSTDSLAGLTVGDAVPAGTEIAKVGASDVNGGWPPHLHLQLVCDMLGHDGEFPGVCGISERAVMLSVSPDPTRIAGATETGQAENDRSERILEARHARIGPSLSISYDKPLHIVRGFMQKLYDSDAQPYLDCVNNVAHVGHCHPRVVAAAATRKAVLETNTRYLHRDMVRLAERLGERLPSGLDVCYFVNSGSEANELALRLARTWTDRHGVVVLDAGYHGNTTTLIDVSPYKHDGPGGSGAPPWIRKIPLPDPYRGLYRNDVDAGTKYARHIDEVTAALRANGYEPAAFLAESIVSCGGQIVPPDGFLKDAYARVRELGAVCIADEVQTGLGRVGDAFWAFELQGVVPDIVTIGKPFGNGHPLAAVITTREIADAFATGMEYFNTFGGNTASCAVGLAVLDVIEDERLQEHAQTVGTQMLHRLRELQQRHHLIGDVRGHGLFLGLELVGDRDVRDPAPEAAAWLIERARDKGVLLSTDGPDNNVVKIKPPLCFSPDDADHLAAVIDEVLSEDYFRPGGQGTAGARRT